MKRFTYRLEKILNLRAWKEEETRLKLAGVVGRINRLSAESDGLSQQQAQTWHQRQNYLNDAASLAALERYQARLQGTQERLALQRAGLEQERLTLAELYRQAHAQKSILERLKEKQVQLYRKESSRQAVKTADDQTQARLHRASQEI